MIHLSTFWAFCCKDWAQLFTVQGRHLPPLKWKKVMARDVQSSLSRVADVQQNPHQLEDGIK